MTSLEYCSSLDYSPREKTQVAVQSREWCGYVKNARRQPIEQIIARLKEEPKVIAKYFDDSTLVPVPKSSLFKEGARWTSKEIADILLANGLGKKVIPAIARIIAVKPSHTAYTAATRTKISEHLKSLHVHAGIIQTDKITLIDDVLTMGRTTFSCALKLQEQYPYATIRLYSVIRTNSYNFQIIDNLVEGDINYNPLTDDTSRN